MLCLDQTTRKLQIVLAGAVTTNQLDTTVVFYDVNTQAKASFEDYRRTLKFSASNNTTDSDICDAPQSTGVARHISHVAIHNRDTVNATVTVKIDDNGTDYIQAKKTLAAGETLHYERRSGWKVL